MLGFTEGFFTMKVQPDQNKSGQVFGDDPCWRIPYPKHSRYGNFNCMACLYYIRYIIWLLFVYIKDYTLHTYIDHTDYPNVYFHLSSWFRFPFLLLQKPFHLGLLFTNFCWGFCILFIWSSLLVSYLLPCLVGGWTNKNFQKYMVKLDHFPKVRGEYENFKPTIQLCFGNYMNNPT